MKKYLFCLIACLFLGSCASRGPAPMTFFAFGDWGSGTADQKAVASAVKDFCQAERCSFGLLLGDNFYETGVNSVDDPQWQEKFEQVYAGLDLPFYAVLGNHDHAGNAQAEIDYTAQQGRWKMPAHHYRVAYPEGAAEPLVEIFAFDSGPSSDDGFVPADADFLDLMQRLKSSKARWKILVMHHPIYSNGNHGDSPSLKALIPEICNQVDVVLSGHDHLFSHLDDPQDGCSFQQWVVGTGGKGLYAAQADDRSLFSESSFGFASIRVNENSLEVQFHRADKSIADSYSLKK